MMAAYLGARSDMITGLLCHDMVEDCGITSERIRKEIGKSDGHGIRVFVSLLTKPVLAKIRTEEGQMEVWVSYIENPLLWSTCTQLPCNNKYTERMNLHYDSILNADPTRAPANIRLQAFVGKMLDALDNLVTDEYLDAVNASLRLTVLVSQIRHLSPCPRFTWNNCKITQRKRLHYSRGRNQRDGNLRRERL